MGRSAALKRSMALSGRYLWERPRRPKKIPANIELWKKLIARYFVGHDWIDDPDPPKPPAWQQNLRFLMCRNCRQYVSNVPYWTKGFQIVIRDQIAGWSASQLAPCEEAQVFLVQNA